MLEQPYQYRRRDLAEPDWRRLPGWARVTREEWESAQWQRAHSVKNLRQLRDVNGGAAGARDSLHEAEMWAVEGLTHRYPTKVLAELLPTCPQYCGHCTRMDLVGNPTPVTDKHKFALAREDRLGSSLGYPRRSPGVRDVVVSGGDVANLPWPRLESFVAALLEIDSIRDIRLASKALMGLPQHWLSDEVRAGMARLAGTARSRGVSIAIHTHVNAAQSVTPLVAQATAA